MDKETRSLLHNCAIMISCGLGYTQHATKAYTLKSIEADKEDMRKVLEEITKALYKSNG